MAVALPYPIPDPETGEWNAFALKRNLEFLAQRIDSAIAVNQTTVLFRVVGNPYHTLASSAAETTVYSTTVTGGVFDTFRTLRLTMQGDILNDTGSDRTVTWRFKYGGTTFATVTSDNISASGTRRAWQTIQGALTAVGTAMAQFNTIGLQVMDTNVSGGSQATGTASATRSAHNALAIDTSIPQTFAITAQLSTSSADLSLRTMLIAGELL